MKVDWVLSMKQDALDQGGEATSAVVAHADGGKINGLTPRH